MKEKVKIVVVLVVILFIFLGIFFVGKKVSLNNYLNKTEKYLNKINYTTGITLNIESLDKQSKIEYTIARTKDIKNIIISKYDDEELTSSINKYLEIKSNQNSIIRIDTDLLKCGSIYNTINDYCKSYNIFKVNNGLYIPKLMMNEKGINRLKISEIIKEMKNVFSDTVYFSVENIKNEINIQNIVDLGFDDEFIENIVFYNSEISTLRINNHKLFSFLKKKMSIQTFIEDEMDKYRSISISDFVNNVNEEYSIDLTYDVVKGYVYGLSNIYYSQILDKLYVDKEDFYKEIYDE